MATAPTTDCATRMVGNSQSHTDAKNRLQQTVKDWDRISKQQRPPAN
ncbi:MAG: hypothetical protein Q8L16_20645 [Hydrogenophaga sp.]|nr:hypothetical protein [Hydrogenophaga sp.]